MYPIDLVVDKQSMDRLEYNKIPPLGSFDPDLMYAWFIPREVLKKTTKNGKEYWIVKTIDSTSSQFGIKCWGVNPKKDKVDVHALYIAKLNYDEQWGFSIRGLHKNLKKVG